VPLKTPCDAKIVTSTSKLQMLAGQHLLSRRD
jgi:hypothetical protein